MNRTTACFCLIALLGCSNIVKADSAIELLSGFDHDRIEAAYPPGNAKTFGELAKMVYRMGSVSRDLVAKKANSDPAEIGDAISIEGTIVSLRTLRVPESLVEFLEFPVFQDAVVQVGDDQTKLINVIASRLPTGAKAGDRVEAVGILIQGDSGEVATPAMVSTPMKWFPKAPKSAGWQLLSGAGVDVSELAQVATRNKLPLSTEDNEAFYQMLSVSDEIGQSPVAAQVEPTWIEPVELLQSPNDHIGDWVRMRLQTVRVTRIAIDDPKRRDQLGSDHYFQIDANGDLNGVIIRVPRADDDPGEPIQFDGTYPVSLVTTKLPDFLVDAIRRQEGGEVVTSMITTPIQIEGFFFRLWSYSTEFMERRGAGKQVGPLLMVARMTDRSRVGQGGIGAEIFGYIAAVAIIGGILGTLIWSRYVSREDRQVREKQQLRDSERIDLPG
ncbi:MAG: hypothetical protein WBD20_05355 [Pirellulaceae bacterium]